MPPATRIRKEDILNAAYQIVRVEGMEGINARAIAKKLNCSIQPIFYQFTNMEELKEELLKKVMLTYKKYLTDYLDQPLPYKEIGKGYIRFAREEPVLFRIIFMSEAHNLPENYIERDKKYYNVMKYVSQSTQLTNDKIEQFHLKMWIFTHGIATMLATKTCDFTEEEISHILTEEFQALMLLEKEGVRHE